MNERIRQFRKEKTWTQEEMARYLRVSTATVVRWEHGKATPSPLALDRLKAHGFKD